MNSEVLVILVGIATVALLWLLLRFGRQIARVLLVGGVLVLAILLAAALFGQASATRKVAQVAQVATVASAGASIGTVILALVTLTSVGTGGYFWIRWKLLERRLSAQAGIEGRLAPGRERRRRLPEREREERESLYYYEDDDAGIVDIHELDLGEWGW